MGTPWGSHSAMPLGWRWAQRWAKPTVRPSGSSSARPMAPGLGRPSAVLWGWGWALASAWRLVRPSGLTTGPRWVLPWARPLAPPTEPRSAPPLGVASGLRSVRMSGSPSARPSGLWARWSARVSGLPLGRVWGSPMARPSARRSSTALGTPPRPSRNLPASGKTAGRPAPRTRSRSGTSRGRFAASRVQRSRRRCNQRRCPAHPGRTPSSAPTKGPPLGIESGLPSGPRWVAELAQRSALPWAPPSDSHSGTRRTWQGTPRPRRSRECTGSTTADKSCRPKHRGSGSTSRRCLGTPRGVRRCCSRQPPPNMSSQGRPHRGTIRCWATGWAMEQPTMVAERTRGLPLRAYTGSCVDGSSIAALAGRLERPRPRRPYRGSVEKGCPSLLLGSTSYPIRGTPASGARGTRPLDSVVARVRDPRTWLQQRRGGACLAVATVSESGSDTDVQQRLLSRLSISISSCKHRQAVTLLA
eukprot:m.415616 g.415616  ORF g.415616 m.415616 type:complete len:472 (-) comp29701_c0_seq1:71-1486(-)